MKPEKKALPDASPCSAKVQTKKMHSLNSRAARSAQAGLIELREGNRVAARIVSGGQSSLLFVASDCGMRQVGVYPNRRRALAALGGFIP